jgi:hypothetical protein
MKVLVVAPMALAVLGVFGVSEICAQEVFDEGPQSLSQESLPPAASPWSFRVSPYVWFAGLSGDVRVGRNLPAIDVDVDFGDVFDKIDWFPPPVMVAGEVRYDRFGAFTDVIFLGLDADNASTIGPVTVDADLQLDTLVWTFGGSFRAVETDRLALDLLAGGRLWNVDAKARLSGPFADRERDGSRTWVDPIIGINGRIELGGGLAFQAEGDVGGFGVASDIDWQLLGTFQYEIPEFVTLAAGYRYIAVDFDDGDFLFDVAMQGPIIGATFGF